MALWPSTMIADFSRAIRFVRENDVPTVWAFLKRRDTPVKVQFLKYAIVGASATIIQLGISLALSYTLLQAIDQAMDPSLRSRNLSFNNAIGFVIASIYGYILNATWIFTPGRHKRWLEALLFFAVATVSFASGNALTSWLVQTFNMETLLAEVAFIVTSVLVNFVCRKFLVFQK